MAAYGIPEKTVADGHFVIKEPRGRDRLHAGVSTDPDDAGTYLIWESPFIKTPHTEIERALALEGEGVRVLEAVRHPHKLRTGQLRGNRFELKLRDLSKPGRVAPLLAQRTGALESDGRLLGTPRAREQIAPRGVPGRDG